MEVTYKHESYDNVKDIVEWGMGNEIKQLFAIVVERNECHARLGNRSEALIEAIDKAFLCTDTKILEVGEDQKTLFINADTYWHYHTAIPILSVSGFLFLICFVFVICLDKFIIHHYH